MTPKNQEPKPDGGGKKKGKKAKTVWVDDGRSLADMSEVRGGLFPKSPSPPSPSSAREKLSTFFSVVKLMLLPTLVAVGALALGSLLLWLAFGTK